jgi:hypothetical protein
LRASNSLLSIIFIMQSEKDAQLLLTAELIDGNDTVIKRNVKFWPGTSVVVGRASQDSSKGLTPADGNMWCTSAVVSRNHATISYSEMNQVCVLLDSSCSSAEQTSRVTNSSSKIQARPTEHLWASRLSDFKRAKSTL